MDALRKAVFLDRDGVINNNADRYYTWKPEDLEINPGVIETLKELKNQGYLLVVITNQGGVGKGLYSMEEVESFHQHLNSVLGKDGAAIDEFYYCPHHSDLEKCLCRKPKGLMIQKAIARFKIDPMQSWMIGDSGRDIDAGKAVGLRTILVKSNGNLLPLLGDINKDL